jgi:hypothetical protein
MSAMIAYFAAAVNVAAAIPYRTGSAVSPSAFAWALLATLLVLGAIIAGLVLARRRGWLRFWASGRQIVKQDSNAWQVSAKVRLSATARAYVLESKDASYLVIESSQHVAIQPQTRATGEEHARGG